MPQINKATIVANADFLLVTEAALLLRVSPSTVYGWIHARKIPFRKHGSRVVLSKKDLEAWSQSKQISTLDTDHSNHPHPYGIERSAPKPASSLKTEREKLETTTSNEGVPSGSV